jgi:hypothetical protein
MSLVRVFEDPEYWPEYGTFLIRDVAPPEQARPLVGPLLAEYAVETQPCGSIARAGDGWLDGVATDDRHLVRIEVYDAPPSDDDLSGWNDVVDLPFASAGAVSMAWVVGGPVSEAVELGAPGVYRVQFARRPVMQGTDDRGSAFEYRLRFWPVNAPAQPPRWLRRTRPLVAEQVDARDIRQGAYRRAISDVVMLVLWAAESATPVTLAWLADRLLATTAIVRAVIEHPKAVAALTVDGDLDDVDAPLTVTVHARKPVRSHHTLGHAVAGSQSVASRSMVHGSPAVRSSPGTRAVPGARSVPAQPMITRQGAAGAQEKQSSHDGPDKQPGGRADVS